MTTTIAQITNQVYDLLANLTAEERGRALSAVLALFGDQPTARASIPANAQDDGETDAHTLGAKAKRWMKQEGVTFAELEEVFHIDDGGKVELIATTIPGTSKREQTGNVYLLSGIRSLLESDEPTVDNTVAVEYCKHVTCYDKNNHTANRGALGNKITGSIANGFTLPAPGLKSAAAVVKLMNKPPE